MTTQLEQDVISLRLRCGWCIGSLNWASFESFPCGSISCIRSSTSNSRAVVVVVVVVVVLVLPLLVLQIVTVVVVVVGTFVVISSSC